MFTYVFSNLKKAAEKIRLNPQLVYTFIIALLITGAFIYIYSTPVIVTVKTDKDGEWHYVMDKELESGEHTVYTATVNNTGKILAQSSGFQFVKTAEAATLGSLPSIQVTSEVQKPGLFNPGILMTIGVMFLIVIISSLIAIGVYSKTTNA